MNTGQTRENIFTYPVQTLMQTWIMTKQTNETAKTAKKERDNKIYKVITGSAVLDFFGRIRDSAIIENMRAFISDCVIVNKIAFMTVYNITLMFATYCSLSIYRAYSLVVSDLRSETKSSRFVSSC